MDDPIGYLLQKNISSLEDISTLRKMLSEFCLTCAPENFNLNFCSKEASIIHFWKCFASLTVKLVNILEKER